jgi:hypothetical protein
MLIPGSRLRKCVQPIAVPGCGDRTRGHPVAKGVEGKPPWTLIRALPRLVLDTNVFVSGLISSIGPPAQILTAIREKKIVHLVSDPVVEDYLRGLSILAFDGSRKSRMPSSPILPLTLCMKPSGLS